MDELAYDLLLTEAGEEKMADAMPVEAVEIVTESLSPYVDYFLGDSITVILGSETKRFKVLEIVESWDSGGYRVTPSLGFEQ